MKPQQLLLAIALFFTITGCKKLDAAHPHSSVTSTNVNLVSGDLVTKWQLVQDSTADSMVRTSALVTNYTGMPGDYFDFRPDGFCYTKEGNVYDTLAYRTTAADSIAIQKFGLTINGYLEPCLIKLNTNSAVISTDNIITPGGTLVRMVKLQH